MKGGPAEGKSRPAPTKEIALASIRRHLPETARPAGYEEVDEARLHQVKDQPELGDLRRIGNLEEGVGRQPGSTEGVAADEGLGELGQGGQLPIGPRTR